MPSDLLTVGLPSGIGDVSWCVSKLRHVGPLHYQVANGWPYRTKPYLELLPDCVASASYGPFTYEDIIVFEGAQRMNGGTRWADLATKGWARILIEPNKHLERGLPLADWLPDLPTDYHYPMVTTAEDAAKAAARLQGLPRPYWGISAASYRGSEAWKTWGYDPWARFLRRLHEYAGGTIILMGGAWDDLTDSFGPLVGELNRDSQSWWRRRVRPLPDSRYNAVGKTTCGTMVELLRRMDGYIGFSSGQGILNTVDHGKTFMLWPDHQVELSQSWADPAMLDEGTYASTLWRDPHVVWPLVQQWLAVPDRKERSTIS